jgi:hypothetical protein
MGCGRLVDHVRARVSDYLSMACINRVQQECHELALIYLYAN